jgi:hypothetical protein
MSSKHHDSFGIQVPSRAEFSTPEANTRAFASDCMRAARERTLQNQIQEIGCDTFPDDDVSGRIGKIHHSGEFSFVEAEQFPPTAGYKRYCFVQHFDATGASRNCACLVVDQGFVDCSLQLAKCAVGLARAGV